MRRLICVCVVLLGGVAPSTAAGLDQAAPADFAIRFEYGLCTTDVFDTFKGEFIRDMGPGEAAVSVPVVLPSGSLNAVYRDVLAARFFEYSAGFRIDGGAEFGPTMHYRMQVRSGGVTHTVTWTDRIRPSTSEADRLRDLFTRLIKMVADQPDVKRLPPAGIGCE